MGTLGITALAIAVAVVGVVLAWRTPPAARARDLVVPGLGLVGAWSVATVALWFLDGTNILAQAHLAYLVATVAVPATAVALLVAGGLRGARWTHRALVAPALLLAPLGWYGTHVEPFRLQVERVAVDLPAARAGEDPIRVGVISDIQTGAVTSYEIEAVERLQAMGPDLILIAGDLYQGDDEGFEEQLPAFRDLLGRLDAPGGVFAVRGDTDIGDRLDRIVDGSDIEVLDDRVVSVAVGDRQVRLAGNRLRWAPNVAIAARQELLASSPEEVRILFAHRPEVIGGLPPGSGVDLVVAGHTHGGQVVLPVIGPLLTSSTVSDSVAVGGLHAVDGNPLYVSSGVGVSRLQAPQVRLFAPPSIALVTLR